MNTINDRPNVAFGMKFTPRAKVLIKEHAGELLGNALSNIYSVRKPTPHLTNIRDLVNHKRTNDLTLDIIEDKKGLFKSKFSFTKGSELKRSISLEHTKSAKIEDMVSGLCLKLLKTAKKNLKKDYEAAKVAKNKADALSKLSQQRKIIERVENAELIPELQGEHSAADLKELFLGAPERFKFKADDAEKKTKLLVSTTQCPIFLEFDIDYPKSLVKHHPSGAISYIPNNINLSEELLKFEETTLKPQNIIIRKTAEAINSAKIKLEVAFNKNSGMSFTEKTKKIILESPDFAPAELRELLKLAKRKSSSNLQFAIKDIGFAYNASILVKGTENLIVFDSARELPYVIKKVLKIGIQNIEAVGAKESAKIAAMAEKTERFNALKLTDAYKNKFDKNSEDVLQYCLSEIDLENLERIVNGTPKLKLRIDRREDDFHLLVAHEDYPRAGFVKCTSTHAPWHLFLHRTPEDLNVFAEQSVKKAHEEALRLDAARAELKNIFAQAKK